MNCIRRLLQSETGIYFKTTCDFLCKFLQHVTNLEDDRLVRSCADVTNHYMQISDERCRMNALFLFDKFLSHLESLDEDIFAVFRITLPKRIRDKKAAIRAQAVLASRKFQDDKLIQDGFQFHYQKDPELAVRKALLQTMDVSVFGLGFLVESTQDNHEIIRRKTFQRLSKISPSEFSKEQLHMILHNGLFERERQASFAFKTSTLDPWLSKMYDGLDLVKLLRNFDITQHPEDIERLLVYIHQRDLDKMENNGGATKLHHVVEAFRERWLDHKCLPIMKEFNERVVIVWLSLVEFCKKHHNIIKSVKIRTIRSTGGNANESIEKILSSQEQNDEVAELYERLTPDLVNLIDFLKRYVQYIDPLLHQGKLPVKNTEFTYQRLMGFIATYEIGDEIERKTAQEVLGLILKENLLTDRFDNFIPPIVKCLSSLIYSKSSNLMINYISELIQNIRSHLEDLAMPTHPATPRSIQPTLNHKGKTPKSALRKASANDRPSKRVSLAPMRDEQDLAFKLATIGVELEELKDQYEGCIKAKDFDQAKSVNDKIENLKIEHRLLHERRYSIASDVSHMTLEIDDQPDDNKLSSTMIAQAGGNFLDDSDEEIRIFKHHPNEMIKCFQMYYACLESVKISEVPPIMLNHLEHLSCESLDDWFKGNTRVWVLMVACNGLTALIDKKFAELDRTKAVFESAFIDKESKIEMRTIGFRCIVDVVVQHEDIEIPMNRVEEYLKGQMRKYGHYDSKLIKKNELEFLTTIIHGVAKLYFHRKLNSAELLSHMICWWYHPRTHSTLTQFIGVFLPAFVKASIKKITSEEDKWLEELLAETYITSTLYLYNYISREGRCIMSAIDIQNLLNFLANLVPTPFHPRVHDYIDKAVDDHEDRDPDLATYLKNSKRNLATIQENPLVTSCVAKRTSECEEE